jgi:hypothetical protein
VANRVAVENLLTHLTNKPPCKKAISILLLGRETQSGFSG